MTNYDVLVFGAHPDDSEMAMGGTLIKLVKAGFSVMNISLTQGEMSTHGTVESRKLEFANAAKVMGCSSLMLDLPDSALENDRASRLKATELIREYKPKLVFAPYHTNNLAEPRGVANVDHYVAGSIVRDAVKYARLKKILPDSEPHSVKKMFFYMVPRNITPSLIVDVTDVEAELRAAIRAYESQMSISFKGKAVDDFLMKMRSATGINIGVEFAEAFVTDQFLEFEPKHFFEL
ncbi:MAG: PIG-L family deacetylase [Deltaproteobacteria bacterium]|nr:PIG-L family deacetylase [Deltaproteobacteria bacterium]